MSINVSNTHETTDCGRDGRHVTGRPNSLKIASPFVDRARFQALLAQSILIWALWRFPGGAHLTVKFHVWQSQKFAQKLRWSINHRLRCISYYSPRDL